jgi:hypothetical protein
VATLNAAEKKKTKKSVSSKKLDSATKGSHWQKRMQGMSPDQKIAFQKKVADVRAKMKGMSAEERKVFMEKLKEKKSQNKK